MIYLVVGQTGEYSDYQEWNVRAFHDKVSAQALCGNLNEWCREKNLHEANKDWSRITCPLDPHFQCDYSGTKYIVAEVPDD